MSPRWGLRDLVEERVKAKTRERIGDGIAVTPEDTQAMYEQGIAENNVDLIKVARFRAAVLKMTLVEPPVPESDIDYVKKSLGL